MTRLIATVVLALWAQVVLAPLDATSGDVMAVSGIVNLRATVETFPGGIRKLYFYINDTLVGVTTNLPPAPGMLEIQ